MESTIELGGKKRPVSFGFYAFKVFEDETGISFTKMGESLENMNVDILTAFIYSGLCSGAKKSNQAIDFSRDDIYDWLDDFSGSIDSIVKVFTDSMPKSLTGKNVKAPSRK